MTDRQTGGWRGFGLGLLGGLLGWAAAASVGCDVRGSKHPDRPADCPACECKCDCNGSAGGAGVAVGGSTNGGPDVRDILDSATRKFNKGDGAGCIADLDAHDRKDPKRRSNDPQNPLAMTRGQCMMLAGRCDAGKGLLREAFANTGSMNMMGPEQIERSVETMASMYCRGQMSPRDQLLQGYMQLSMGASSKRMTVAECAEAYDKVRRNRDTVKPRDDDDHQVASIPNSLYAVAPGCFARAGDCKQARRVFDESFPPDRVSNIADPKQRAEVMTLTFESMAARCKPK